MLRMGLSPVTVETASPDLFTAAARLAREYKGVGLHTHLAENSEEVGFCEDRYGCRPGKFMK